MCTSSPQWLNEARSPRMQHGLAALAHRLLIRALCKLAAPFAGNQELQAAGCENCRFPHLLHFQVSHPTAFRHSLPLDLPQPAQAVPETDSVAEADVEASRWSGCLACSLTGCDHWS